MRSENEAVDLSRLQVSYSLYPRHHQPSHDPCIVLCSVLGSHKDMAKIYCTRSRELRWGEVFVCSSVQGLGFKHTQLNSDSFSGNILVRNGM